ncbi:hypothetical protein [Sphingobacterium paucimobilis]|uniref:Lipoprotein n=1 Tax=Sphingobacterium paucimobilis HER1398 TaxID=1346330 RepID=U2IZG0_9SPHI|nr:hypothetical protein [Sphingobacterium paucimobilis]ERJ58054.1 hypothetical protein M472_04680 [Sphingobacterium paucimobilis HER1398]
MKSLNSFLGLGVAFAVTMGSCNNASQENKSTTGDSTKNTASIEQLTNNKEADKQTLFLRFTEETSTDSSMIYTAKSLFDKDTVGLKIEVLKDIKPGLTNDGKVDQKAGFVKGSIKFSSLGGSSDAFVKALGTMFKLPTADKMTEGVILPTVFSSNKTAVDLTKPSTYSFKLFFENGAGEPAEIFGVVDTYRKAFEFSEKDSTFRKQFVAAFEGK